MHAAHFCLVLLLASAAPARAGQSGTPEDPLPPADPAILAATLEHHVRFLASDELLGRKVATPETVRAAHYLARAMQRAGLEPAGDEGTFLQAVPFVRTSHSAVPELTLIRPGGETVEAAYGVDFSTRVRGAPTSTGVLDLRLVRSLEELDPEPDPSVGLVMVARAGTMKEWLAERGAPNGAGWGLVVRLGRETPGRPGRVPRGSFGLGGEAAKPTGPVELTLRGPLRAQVEAGDFARLELTFHGAREEVVDYNVVGRLAGDPGGDLAAEAIVVSAHYDHIGTTREHGSAEEGVDTIRNGADDDASGVAALLELAEAAAAEAREGGPPARTLIFLLATGEEVGVLGTRYYIAHPALPLERTVANLNLEMLGRPDPLVGGAGKLWLTGFERSSLGPAFREHGIDVVEDQRPDQNFFMRSDNIVFVREGIVGQTLSSYNMHRDYHGLKDEADRLDYDHMQAAVRAAHEALRLLADGSVTPTWNEGEPKLGRR